MEIESLYLDDIESTLEKKVKESVSYIDEGAKQQSLLGR